MYTSVLDPITDTPSAALVRRDADGALIPADPANTDWQAYQSWLGAGNSPTTPEVTSSPASLVAYAQAAQRAVLTKGQTFDVATSGQPAVSILCDGTNDTRADLALLALFGQINPTGMKDWLDNNGKTTSLTGSQFVALATLAGDWVSDTYQTIGGIITGILASPPTVTTTAEIDATAWPTI